MKDDDHLSNEVSLEVSVTETGAKAAVKSRFAAAVDRLGGNLVDWVNISLESANVRNRAKSDGERLLLGEVAKHGVRLLGNDPEFVERALDTHFGRLVRTQKNKDAVLKEALDHLSGSAESAVAVEETANSEDLAPEFLDRFERYAAEASTDDLRSRWGRVLAREVRTPGSMSNRAMRIVDELDPRTAQLFEQVCERGRVGDVLIHCLVHDITLPQLLSLDDAGLITYSGGGIARPFHQTGGATPLLIIGFGDWLVSLRTDTAIPESNFLNVYAIGRGGDSVSSAVIKLTDAGQAVASILPDRAEHTLRRFIEVVHTVVPDAAFGLYRKDTTGMSRSYGVFVNGYWSGV